MVLGSGDHDYESMFRALAEAYPQKVGLQVGYDTGLSHRIEAGADMFLMPSRYEPCGLNQIYSLKYGTVPVVRATGGLDDTIDEGTGFKFRDYSGDALLDTVRMALKAYRDLDSWIRRMRRGMEKDFSWRASAGEYVDLYRRLDGGLNPFCRLLHQLIEGSDSKKHMAGANTLTFTDAGWDKDVLNSDAPVLVDFWAEWCGPCRMMTPTIDAIAEAYAGRVKVGKLNVDENGATSMRYNVRGIPTLLLFKGGKVVEQKVGAVGKTDVQKMLDAHVAAPQTA